MVSLTPAVLLLLGLCTHSVHAHFKVFRGDEVQQLEAFSDIERLAVAANVGEAHVVELIGSSQAGVVQEDVSISIDCLPLLSQRSMNSLKWTFVQLDEFGEISDPSIPPKEIRRNVDHLPQPRIVVGGEMNRWLNITSTVNVQGAVEPDSKIFMCEICDDFETLEGCNTSTYTQFVIGTPPLLRDTSDELCILMDTDAPRTVLMECEILNDPQPTPRRTWFKDGKNVYSDLTGSFPDLTEYFIENSILVTGVLDPITITAPRDGTIYYNYEVMNITFPALLPPDTTIAQAEQQVFQHLLGNWSCTVDNTLGSATVTYKIRECETNNISFETGFYAVGEEDGYVEVCIVSTKYTEIVDVVITPLGKGVENSTAGVSDFISGDRILSFDTTVNTRVCINITILDDHVYEGDEQFLVMFGNLPNAEAGVGLIQQACVTIVDDEIPEFTITPTSITVLENVSMVEVCISSETQFEREVMVTAETGPTTGATNQATAESDYKTTRITLTFVSREDTIQMYCRYISIIDDKISNEPDEYFSITITDSIPNGKFIDDTTFITIIDDDNTDLQLADATAETKRNRIITAVVVVVAIIIIIVLTSIIILVVTVNRKNKGDTEKTGNVDVKSEDINSQVTNSKEQAETN